MKKWLAICVAVLLPLTLLAGCDTNPGSSDGHLSVVTTVFPVCDWVRCVLGDRAEETDVTMLLDNGVDLHSYQPTANDLIRIAQCDVFVYIGGESDAWVEGALQNPVNADRRVVNLMEALGDMVKQEELVEGMETDEDETDGDEIEYDEHIWLSLKNATLLVRTLRDVLSEADAEHADTYASCAATYIRQLQSLDAAYQSAVDAAAVKTVLFGDRFPFRYLTDDYGLTYYAAFMGCSAESEAGFETIAFLADKVNALSLPAVLTLEGTDHKIAETVVATSGREVPVLSLDSLQSTTSADVQSGVTYLSVMTHNLDVLKSALG